MDEQIAVIGISMLVTMFGATLTLFVSKWINEKQESNFDYEGWERHQTERRLHQLEHDLKRLRQSKPKRKLYHTSVGNSRNSRKGSKCLRRH